MLAAACSCCGRRVLDAAGDAALAALVVAVALGLISAPLWWRMVRRLGAERMARVRSQERAEVAAHLHDSVLQTLALMQKRAGEPEEVAKLARRQERELRSWLAGGEPARPGERLADALRAAAEEVEEQHGAQVEAVVVGDAPSTSGWRRWSPRPRGPHQRRQVRLGRPPSPLRGDRGRQRPCLHRRSGSGLRPRAIPDDRRGVRESIIGRMKRYGGRAEIRSGPGDGTEIELAVEGGSG